MIQDTRAYKYAKWCVEENEGKAPRYVKKQCQNWLDIADGKVEGCYVSFSEYKKIKKILKLMIHPDLNCSIFEGLEDYAMLFVIAVLCTYKRSDDLSDKRRKYTLGILEIARKNFKTFTSATIFIITMLTEQRFSRLFSVAPDYKLSSELRLAVRKIILSSPLLRDNFKITRDMVTCKITDIEYTPLAYSNDRMDGKLATLFLADEDGAMDSYPVEAMTSSQITLRNKLGIIISTQYPKDNNDFLSEIDMSKRILNETLDRDDVFSLLYEPDDELINSWEEDDRVLYQSNPVILDKPLMYDELIKKRKMALLYDNKKENFLCKHCNIRYKSVGTEGYVDLDKVKLCRGDVPDEWWRGRSVYLGCDLSLSEDNTAVAMTTNDDGTLVAKVVGFIPEEAISNKTNKEEFDYFKAIKDGECIACGDSIIDYSVVEDYILTLEEKYGVHVIVAGFDRWNAVSSMQKLEAAKNPIQCAEIKQHSSVLHPATKLLKEKILQKKFRYSANLMLENNFSNARCTEDTNLNKYVNKKKSTGKVDMVVALINAVYLLNEYEYLSEELVCQYV